MGKVMSYERALEVHKEWKERQARKKAREQARAQREEEERKKRIAKDAEIRKRREEKQAELQRKMEEEEAERFAMEARTMSIYHKKWMVRERDDNELYTKDELEHIDELYPEETGRLTEKYWEMIGQMKAE